MLGIVVFALSSSFSLSEVEALFNCLSLKRFRGNWLFENGEGSCCWLKSSSGFWMSSNELLNFDVLQDNYEQQSWICSNKIFLWWGEQETCKEEKKLHARRQDIKLTYSTKHWRFSKKDCTGNERHKWTRDTENPKWGGESILNDTTIIRNYWLKWEILS